MNENLFYKRIWRSVKHYDGAEKDPNNLDN